MEEKKMVNKKSWEEFRSSGLLWFTNTILHMFGWAIVCQVDDGKVVDAYPARVRFRGFDENSASAGYERVTDYLKEHIDELVEEAHE